jgi:hypothetical protein
VAFSATAIRASAAPADPHLNAIQLNLERHAEGRAQTLDKLAQVLKERKSS